MLSLRYMTMLADKICEREYTSTSPPGRRRQSAQAFHARQRFRRRSRAARHFRDAMMRRRDCEGIAFTLQYAEGCLAGIATLLSPAVRHAAIFQVFHSHSRILRPRRRHSHTTAHRRHHLSRRATSLFRHRFALIRTRKHFRPP